jgi:hypothetical protein
MSLREFARTVQTRLDGVWSVQLFFRTWPYYAARSSSRHSVPLGDFDYVLSEQLPRPALPAEQEAQLNAYTTQMWGMSIVYIEAILEFYFQELITRLSLDQNKVPRQASKLLEYVQKQISEQLGHTLTLPSEQVLQLLELTQTRHLWVHGGGVVDSRYLSATSEWWSSRPGDWMEPAPLPGQERALTETYIKSSIWFSKRLISIVDEQLAGWGY